MKKIWKENAKLILIVTIAIVLTSGATYAATTMYNSNIVGYDNTTSGLNSNNVQDALDEVYSAATDYTDILARLSALEERNIADEIYPVGSIYIGVSNTNPSTLFGGTWVAFGTGKTLVGVDTNDTSFDTVEETGGNKTNSYTPLGTVGNTKLTVDQIPSHTHNYVKATGVGNHTLTVAEMPSHRHQMVEHPAGSEGTGTSYFGFHQIGESYSIYQYTDYVGGGGAHNHPLNTSTVASEATGGDGSHTHSFTGTAANISTVQPYITVYMWKRMA